MCGLQYLGASPLHSGNSGSGSVVVARGPHWLSSYGLRALECRLSSCGAWAQLLRGMWDPPDQGSNPCPLHWRADSQPLHHQGSPTHVATEPLKCGYFNRETEFLILFNFN